MKLARLFLLAALVVTMLPLGAVSAGAAEGCETCTACGDWQEFPLYAAQDWEVGVVKVNNCEDKIGVQYVLFDSVTDDGFAITEVHLDVAGSLDEIPQTKKKNPIPGEFEVNEAFPNGVAATEVYCFDREAGWDAGDPLYIAAHAVVGRPAITRTESQPFCVLSGSGASVVDGEVITPATLAWVHPLWNSNLTMNLPAMGANWIWNSYRVNQPVTGEIVEFSHEFELQGTPTEGTLYATADNGFEAAVNLNVVGDSTNLLGDWRNSDLTEAYVNTSAGIASWGTVRTFDVGAFLNTGMNELAVTGVNEQLNGGTIDSNPAGVIYALCGKMDVEVFRQDEVYETAWGGEDPFDGKNWAKYIVYTIQDCVTCTPCVAPFYPFKVIDYSQGIQKSGAAVLAARSNPDAVLAYESATTSLESHFFSLGFKKDGAAWAAEGGWVIGEFECPVPNGPGDDFRVIEDTWGTYPLEQAKVYVSQDGLVWTYVGMANNTNRTNGYHTSSYFDLDSVGMAWFKYVKVVDATNPAIMSSNADGYDLNTVEALHDSQVCE